MSLAIVQAHYTGGFGASGFPANILAANATVGNAVAAFVVVSNSGSVNSPSSPMGTFSLEGSSASAGAIGSQWVFCPDVTTASQALTVTNPVSGGAWLAFGIEISGYLGGTLTASGPTAGATGPMACPFTGGATGNVALAGLVTGSGNEPYTPPSTPWTDISSGGSFSDAAYAIMSAASITADWTTSGASIWGTIGLMLAPPIPPYAPLGFRQPYTQAVRRAGLWMKRAGDLLVPERANERIVIPRLAMAR